MRSGSIPAAPPGPADEPPAESPHLTLSRVRIPGTARPGPVVTPVTQSDLSAPVKDYRAYITAGLTALVARTGALRAAVDDGDLSALPNAWLPAHLAYERLGAA